MKIIKNHDGSDILLYLQAKKVACCMDAGRRHKAPESETKDFIICGTGRSMSFSFPSALLAPGVPQKGCRVNAVYARGLYHS